MTRLGSFKSQAPTSKEVPSTKPQFPVLDCDHIVRVLGWSLRLELLWSLELGAWSLGARRIPASYPLLMLATRFRSLSLS